MTAFNEIICYFKNFNFFWNFGVLTTNLDRTFGKHNEDHNSTLESTPRNTRVLDPKFLASTLSNEVVQDEEEAGSSTQSIRIEENLLAVTPPAAPEVYEISDISYSYMDDPY